MLMRSCVNVSYKPIILSLELLCINKSKIALSLFDDAKERNLTIWANLSG